MKASFPRLMSQGEKAMVLNLYNSGMPALEIHRRTGRAFSSVFRVVEGGDKGFKGKPMGRPQILSPKQIDSTVCLVRKLVQQAKGCWEVTMPMALQRSKLKCTKKPLSARPSVYL